MKNLLIILSLVVATAAMAKEVQVDTKKSVIEWKGTKFGGEHFGKIYYKKGSLKLDGEKIVGGNFTVDMNSFTVEDLTDPTWKGKFLGHMKSADFFEVEKYPTSSLKVKGYEKGKIVADLTIKGKTNEVRFPITKMGNAYKGKITFDRTKWGMKYGSGLIGTALDKTINDEVYLDFNVVIKNKEVASK
jgi:polyisoprenoid-binding protein YceI